jgi:nucleoside-diphosphate-sugar epimerase
VGTKTLKKTVLVTGATGFVGHFLCTRLLLEGWTVRGTILASKSPSSLAVGVEAVAINPIEANTSWDHAFNRIDVVIHLAARVHVMCETTTDPLKEFRRVNTEGTINLARQAAANGVRRFVFISTIGVNGNNSGGKPYTENDEPHPHNPYSVSKNEAEQALREISYETGMEVVIVRAPLVYGPGNPGNFLSFLRIISKVLPLPLASLSNKRSIIYVGNLVDALANCASHPAAAGKTYLVSDGEDVSTPELINRMASAMGKQARLFPFPSGLMLLMGRILGKSAVVERLVGSLQVDSSKIQRELGWTPPFTMEQGLMETADWFKNKVSNGKRS